MNLPESLRWLLSGAAVCLVGVLSGLWVALADIRRTQREQAKTLRAVRQQLANVLSMLQRAGYKKGHTLDWSDDSDRTRVRGARHLTRWDWRKPE